jgi:KDO2-lipid IV(A) lauroyltransferase
MNIIVEWIEYILLISFIKLINIFPFKISFKISRGIGLLLFFFDRRHRKVALENLHASFPEKSIIEIKRIAQESFKNIGCIVIEIARVSQGGIDWIKEIVRLEGKENIDKGLKKGKGVLIMTAHIGNWEIGALAGRDWKFNFVVRLLDNRFLNKFIYKIRTKFNSGMIVKKNAIKEILKCLRRNELVAILMDQNTGAHEGIFVDFFARKACTNPVVAILAVRTGAPVLPVFTIREGVGKFKVIIGEEIEIIPSGDYKRDIEKYTAQFTEIIESIVRKYPDQWLWLHRRWKTRP